MAFELVAFVCSWSSHLSRHIRNLVSYELLLRGITYRCTVLPDEV